MLLQVPSVIIKASPPSAHPYIDILVGALPSLIAVGGGLWAVYKYLKDKREAQEKDLAAKTQANETARIESQKPFSAKQQEVYFDLLSTTALISNRITEPDKDPIRAQAMEHFWILFWGVLPVVANQAVAHAADDFSVALDNPMDFVPLRNASMDLARACRGALGTAWNIGFEKYAKSDAAIAKPVPEKEEFYPSAGQFSA
jgi:hypothetical protein